MLIKSSYIWAIFRVRGSSRVISVLLSIYIAPGSTTGLLIHTLDFQSNLQSFWTEPLSKELEAESGQGQPSGHLFPFCETGHLPDGRYRKKAGTPTDTHGMALDKM